MGGRERARPHLLSGDAVRGWSARGSSSRCVSLLLVGLAAADPVWKVTEPRSPDGSAHDTHHVAAGGATLEHPIEPDAMQNPRGNPDGFEGRGCASNAQLRGLVTVSKLDAVGSGYRNREMTSISG